MHAEDEGQPTEIILAAFFHDIGHLLAFEHETESMGGFGVMKHEDLGKELLIKSGIPGNEYYFIL